MNEKQQEQSKQPQICYGTTPLHLDPAECNIEVVPLEQPVSIPLSQCPVLTDIPFATEECSPGFSGIGSACRFIMEVPDKGGVTGKMMRRKPYPRKLKKAVGQICRTRLRGDEFTVCIELKQRTKWQRKAMRMVQRHGEWLSVPTTNGNMLTIEYYAASADNF